MLGGLRHLAVEDFLIDVAQRRDAHAADLAEILHVIRAPAPQSDETDTDIAVRSDRTVPRPPVGERAARHADSGERCEGFSSGEGHGLKLHAKSRHETSNFFGSEASNT